MKAADLHTAATAKGLARPLLCLSIGTLLPVLEEAEARASRWKFWEKIGVRVVISALRAYRAGRCEGGE